MVQYGLEPDWPAQADAELAHLAAVDGTGLRDLRDLPWSSIDNDDSRDLDQLEVCVTKGGTRLLIAIADVDALVVKGLGARRPRAREHDLGVHAGPNLRDAAAASSRPI